MCVIKLVNLKKYARKTTIMRLTFCLVVQFYPKRNKYTIVDKNTKLNYDKPKSVKTKNYFKVSQFKVLYIYFTSNFCCQLVN